MALLLFLVQLLGATMLLLYAVRMVRTGIERAFGASFRRVVTSSTGALRAAGTGLILAVVLQSSAAVGLLAAGFAGAGTLSFATGLAVALGADLGSALVIQVLSFQLDWLTPVLLAVGGALFIRSDQRKLKQAGRIVLGIAFILIALRFLRETMDPIRDSAFLPAIADHLHRDYVTAFLAGVGLAFVMHSSVAAILMCVTLVALGALPVSAGVSLVLGANMGGALIPIWLSRDMSAKARRIPVANFIIRGAGAILALFVVNQLPVLLYLGGHEGAQTVVNVHILFNLMLLVVLPFCRVFEPPMQKLLPEEVQKPAEFAIEQKSVLEPAALGSPQMALASLKREVLRMAQLVEAMVTPVMDVYASGDALRAKEVSAKDDFVDAALDGVRNYVAALPGERMRKDTSKRARELAEYAIALESAADIVVGRLMPLALQKASKNIRFSETGNQELVVMHERLLSNLGLADNVLISDDIESARLLLEEKNEMQRLERGSRKKHLKRLAAGEAISFDSSNIHLETLRALCELNSLIASVAYPILHRGGQLLETRLISELKANDV